MSSSDASSCELLNIGYIFLQKFMGELKLKTFFDEKSQNRRMSFDSYTVLRFLTYARILDPLSKFATCHTLNNYYEKPDFDYQHILRFMDFLEEHHDGYLAWLYKHSNSIVKRDTSVLCYDCSNQPMP